MVELKFDNCKNEYNLLELTDKSFVEKVYKDAAKRFKNTCCGCGYVCKENQKLKLHVERFNEEKPKDSVIAFVLCDACFAIRHIEKAIENEQVVLANSVYSQRQLIAFQRESNKRTMYLINKKEIHMLKKTAKEYLEEIENDKDAFNNKIKVIFGKNFNWDNCK